MALFTIQQRIRQNVVYKVSITYQNFFAFHFIGKCYQAGIIASLIVCGIKESTPSHACWNSMCTLVFDWEIEYIMLQCAIGICFVEQRQEHLAHLKRCHRAHFGTA